MKLTVDGHEVFAHTGGVAARREGVGVVLVHGAGQDHSVWAYQTRMLANQDIPTFAPDLPGHGRSAGAPIGTISGLGNWLLLFLDATGVGRAMVVGHSMGSYLAISAAAAAPARFAGLVLTGTSDRMPVHPALLDAAGAGDLLAAELITGWTHAFGDRFGGNPSPGLWARGLTTRLLERSLDSSLAVSLQAVATHDPTEDAALVECPVTVVVADDDRMANPTGAARLAARFSSGSVVSVPGGHGAMLDHPRGIARAILEAYRSLPESPA